ncbi:MAG: hypothetical protein KDE35_07345 [Geminicoccaceae bacterium]|nr:hypothetical protein [Geminicoccaceae bacterium]
MTAGVRAARILVVLSWSIELLRTVAGLEVLRWPAALLLALYLLLILPSLRSSGRWMALALLGVAVVIAAVAGRPAALLDGLAFATVFPAFLATMVLLRVAAAVHPRVETVRRRVAQLDRPQRQAGFMLAAHLLAALVTAGAFAVLGPLRPAGLGEPDRRRLALACLRGANLAVLWSPFFLGMAVSTQLVPGVPTWQVTVLGLALAAEAMALAMAPMGGAAAVAVSTAVRALAPIVPPVAAAAVLIVAVSTMLGTSPLGTVFVVVPPLVAGWLLSQPKTSALRVVRDGWRGLATLGDEMLLVVTVSILSRVLAAVPWTADLVEAVLAFGLPPVGLIAALLALIVGLALAGLHPLASVSVVLALMAGTTPAIAPLVLVAIGVLGWALGTMVGPTSLSVLLASASFDVAPRRLVVGINLVFVAAFATLAVGTLGLLNGWLTTPG